MVIRRLFIATPSCRIAGGAVAVVLWFSACGCGRPQPRNVLVSGAITLDGKPVAGCNIAFHPAGGGRKVIGMTDRIGRYELTSQKKGDGVPPGRYLVSVNLFRPAPANRQRSARDNDAANPFNDAEQPAELVLLLPKRYSDPATSGLSAEVPEGASAEISFNLKSK